MSLLNRLLKNKPSEVTLEDRIAELQTAEEAELLELVLHSKDVKLREEAIRKISFGKELLDLALGEHPAKLKVLARQHIGELLENNSGLIDTLASEYGKDQLELVNLVSSSPKALETVLPNIGDEEVLGNIALNGATSALRQKAAEKVQSREYLENLAVASKDKDKSVLKIVKTKMEVFKEADARLAEKQAKAAELCIGAENLAKRKLDDYFKSRFEELQAEWDQLDEEASSSSAERFKAAMQDSFQILNEAQEQAKKEQKLLAEQKQARQEVLDLCEKVRAVISGLYESKEIEQDNCESALVECDAQLKTIKEKNPQFENEYKRYFKLAEGARQLMIELQAGGPFPALLEELQGLAQENNQEKGAKLTRDIHKLLRHKKLLGSSLPPLVEQASSSIGAWVKAKDERVEKDKKLLQKVNELVRKANWAIDGGRVRQARGIYKDIQEKREKHTSLPQGVINRLEELDEAMKKLGDWHEFAVLPKKQVVVEKMEALAGSSLHPNDLADKIKALQDEWKLLCKGGENQDAELWERMQAAADKAFEPCREFFDAQADERELNVSKREALIAQMAEYYEAYKWESPVWKDVEQTLTVARETWKTYWPVPRKKIDSLQKKFDSVLDKIHGKLKGAREENQQAKTRLVEIVEKLAENASEQENTTEAIEEAKRLQAQWKALGGVGGRGRSDDQKLWKKFRAACDVIFEKRDQEYKARQDQHKQEIDNANSILSRLDEILSKKEQAFIEARKSVKQIKEEFQGLGDIPEKEQRRIQQDFYKKLEQIENRVSKERKALIKKSWEAVYDIAETVRVYEEAVLSGGDIEETLAAAKEAISENTGWPSGTQEIIQKRLDKAAALKEAASENEKALRLLCIRKEISQGEESPEEDKALRMEYQVEQLKQGFGQKSSSSDSLESLTLEWLAVQGVPGTVYSSLLKRFNP